MSQKNFTIDTGLDIVNGGNISGVTNLIASGNVAVGNIVITNDSILDLAGPKITNGDLTHGSTSGLSVVANGDANATVLYNTYGNVEIFASDTGSNVYAYNFDSSGNANFPGNLSTTGNIAGNYFVGNGSMLTGISVAAGDKIVNGTSNVEVPTINGNVVINANASSWTFDTAGNLTLPTNAAGINYANGTSILSGIGANLGNLAIDNNNIYNTNDLGVVISNFSFVAEEETAYLQIPPGNSTNDLNLVQEQGNIRLVSGGAAWSFNTNAELVIPGDIFSSNHIGIGSGDYIFLSGGDKPPGSGQHGGYINVFAGDGALDTGAGPIAGDGGEVNLLGGHGGTGNVNVGGTGGSIAIEAGSGGHNGTNGAGDGGDVNIIAGGAGFNNGNFAQGAHGGTVAIEAGDTTLENTAGGSVTLTSGAGGPGGAAGTVSVVVPVSDAGAGGTWTFNSSGNLVFPDSTVQSTAYTGPTYGDSNVASFLAAYGSNTMSTTGNVTAGNFVGSGSNVDIVAGSYNWAFDNTGNLTLPSNLFTVNYANGTPVSLGGGSSYGDSNVTTLLGSFGSNSISTTGNITANYVLGNGSQLTAVNAATVDVLNTNGLTTTFYPTFVENRDSAEIVRADVDLTYRTDTNTLGIGNVTVSGTISASGNITGGNLITAGTFQSAGISSTSNIVASGNVVSGLGASNNFVLGNVNSRLTAASSNSYITMDQNPTIVPDTAKSGLAGVVIGGNGYLLGPNGARNITLNYNSVSGAVGLQANVTVGSAGSGVLSVAGNTTTGINAVLAGPAFTPLSNTSAGFVANVNNYTQITFQNKNTGADATADYILTADNGSDTVNYGDFGIINSGYDNSTPTNSLGNIVYAADTYIYAQGNVSNTSQSGGNLVIGTATAGKTVKIFAGGNTASALVANISNTGVSVAGNVTASNFIGNISITGNVVGTSANVSLVAGSYTATFDTTGVLTLPAVGGSEGGEINLGIPTANTTLLTTVKFDVYQDQIRFFDGSAKGVYIDLSQAGAGVSTLLNNRVSGYVNAGTYVTMDNLKATVSTSGNRSLQIATVSGSFSAFVNATYTLFAGGTAGTGASITVTTTPALAINWNFTAQGDTVIYIINDVTNNRTYRVTMMIGGSYNNNMITIERLI